LEGKIDILTGTLGKALGGAAGGFVAGSARAGDTPCVPAFRERSCSPTRSPATVAARRAQGDRIARNAAAALVEAQRANTPYFRDGLTRLGFQAARRPSAIVPLSSATRVRDRDEQPAARGGRVRDRVRLPGRPEGTAADPRCKISSALTRDELDRALAAFEKVGRGLGLIGEAAHA